MTTPPNDPDVRHEPALGASFKSAPDNEAKADATLNHEAEGGRRSRDAAMQSVFDEPFSVTRSTEPITLERDVFCPDCGYNLRGCVAGADCPECGYRFDGGYAQWLETNIYKSTRSGAYLAVTLAVLSAGVLAVAGTFIGTYLQQVSGGIMGIVVFGPTIEEVMKVFAVVWILERKPWLLPNRAAVIVAALAGALGFAVIENLIYVHVYIPDPTPQIIVWRWTVCTTLHVAATGITTVGLVRLWKRAMTRFVPVQLPMAFPYLVGAIVLHGAYNAFALLLDLTGVF